MLATKAIVYTGQLPSGRIDIGGAEILFVKGSPVEVPSKIADELLERKDDWTLAEPLPEIFDTKSHE